MYPSNTYPGNPETEVHRPTFCGGFADPARELTYHMDDDGGSPAPLEELDSMEPTGSTVEAMNRAMRRAKARLANVAPAGTQVCVYFNHRLTTYSDGSDRITTDWMASVLDGSNVVALGTGGTLDDAVLRCVAKLCDRRPATAENKATRLSRLAAVDSAA